MDSKGKNDMNGNRVNITFDFFTLRSFAIKRIIKKCVAEALRSEGITVDCEINILVTTDQGIREINSATRNIDAPTDVLSFPMFELEAGNPPSCWDPYVDPETELCPLGDMAISLERAVSQAQSFGHSVTREIGYLTIHSILHLLGYDHLDEGEQKRLMRRREEEIAARVPGVNR